MKVFTVVFIITVVATLLMFSRTFDGKHFSAVRYSVSFLLLIVLYLEGIAFLIFVF
ncbi:MAG: hypothetical protein IJ731_06100 [Eubacterium sp.]|nr:hypothetical protein [Eubacterium sp.]